MQTGKACGCAGLLGVVVIQNDRYLMIYTNVHLRGTYVLA